MSSFYDDASLVVIPSGYKTSKVYAEKPTDGSGDLAFTRTGDTATRVNSAGLIEKVRTNLALYSEDFTNASWTKAVTVTANAGTAPNGTTTADLIYPSANSSNSVIFNGVTIANSTEYTNSIYVKASGKTWTYIRGINDGVGVWFDVANGVLGTTQSGVSGTITSVGSGWYRCSVTQTSSSTTGRLVVLVVDGDGSTAVTASGTNGLLIWGAQIETGVATDYIPTTTAAVSVGPVANVPRLDYLGSTCGKLLLEPQRTNVALYSEQFNNSSWAKSGSGVGIAPVVTANDGISPDGYQNADKIDLNLNGGTSSSDWSWVFQSFSATGTQPQAFSIYLKAATAGDVGKVIRVGFISYVTHTLTADWTRVVLNQTFGTTSTFYIGFRLRGSEATANTASLYAWGAQLEQNAAYSSSYVPTLAASATRGADACSKTGISSLIGQTEGVFFAEFTIPETQSASFFSISAVSSVNRIIFGYYDGALRFYTNSSTGSFSSQGIIDASPVVGQVYKIAVAYKNNDFAIYKNGVNTNTLATFTVPASLTDLDNQGSVGTGQFIYAGVKQLLLFKTRLTNAQMAELTTL